MHAYNAKINLGIGDYKIEALDEMSAHRMVDAEDDIFRLLVKGDPIVISGFLESLGRFFYSIDFANGEVSGNTTEAYNLISNSYENARAKEDPHNLVFMKQDVFFRSNYRKMPRQFKDSD